MSSFKKIDKAVVAAVQVTSDSECFEVYDSLWSAGQYSG